MRFRAEIAQGRFDDAIRTAKTFFAMSRHLGEHPTLIGDLVGMAIARVAIFHLEKMLVQPGCPNLYWALTNLPSPLIPLDKGMDGERVMLQWVFRDLNDSDPISQDQLKKFVADGDKLLQAGDHKPGVREWLDARTKDEAFVSAARRRLVESGFPEERLLRFPADQVILLDEKREFEDRCDDVVKTINFPFWQVEALDARIKLKKPPALFADLLQPIALGARRRKGGWISGSRCSDTSRHCASTPRSTTAHCPRNSPTFSCRCPLTRSPASRSAMKSMATRLTSAALRPRARKRILGSTSITR